MQPRRLIAVGSFTTGLALALATSEATADDPPAACAAWDVEYSLSARLQLDDTPMGEGDGVYPIGPGRDRYGDARDPQRVLQRRRRSARRSLEVRGYRTDGTLECEGSLCGKFGAPPPGKSELHIPPGPVDFKPFEFAPDRATFTMARAQVSKTEMPKQTGFLALAGRETKRTCVTTKPACAARR